MFEIKNNRGEVMFVADQELYNRIVADIISVGSYTHTFVIYEGKLSATFKTISSSERLELSNKTKDKDSSEFYLASLTYHLVRVGLAETDIQIAGTEDAENKLRILPAPLMDKILHYFNVFMELTDRAFASDDIVKNFSAPAVG